MPDNPEMFDLPRILTGLAELDLTDKAGMEKFLAKEMPGYGLVKSWRQDLKNTYVTYMKMILKQSRDDGVHDQFMKRLIAEAARARNREVPELYRWNSWKDFDPLIADYLRTGDPKALSDKIDFKINSSRRFFRSDDPYELVLEERHLADGTKARKMFNARSGEFRVVGCSLRERLRNRLSGSAE